jgi:hypothetical protein
VQQWRADTRVVLVNRAHIDRARLAEAAVAHWMILLYADRGDAAEHHVRSLLTLRPDNQITETGVKAEFTHNGIGSCYGRKRVEQRGDGPSDR